MYWPYLRSKQNEVLAVRELASNLTSNLVVPIFKPVGNLSHLETRLAGTISQGVRVAIVMNPDQGNPIPPHSSVATMFGNLETKTPGMAFPAYEIGSETTIRNIGQFCATYAKYQMVLVHRNHQFSSQSIVGALGSPTLPPVHVFFDQGVPSSTINGILSSRKVLLRDGFQRQSANGHYPPHSHFGDLVFNFTSFGFNGMSDCGPLGDVFITGGSSPSHVALHLTEQNPSPTLICNHFVSSVSTTSDTETKYFDALEKLVNYTGSPGQGQFATFGVDDFCLSRTNGHFPNLGPPKRWSLKHHIQLIDNLLQNSGFTPFV